jgi:hypothetical protein
MVTDRVTTPFPVHGFPLSDVADRTPRLSPQQRSALRDVVKKLTASQRRHARYTVSGFQGDPKTFKTILIVFLLRTKMGPYHESYMVLNLTHCNVAYDPETTYLFATTGC